MTYIPSYDDLDRVTRIYKGWNRGHNEAFRIVGANDDFWALDIMERSLLVPIPYGEVAVGAATKGNTDMTLLALHKGKGDGVDMVIRALKKTDNNDLLEQVLVYDNS